MSVVTANSTMEGSCPQCGAVVPISGYADMAVCSFCGSTLWRGRTDDISANQVVPLEEDVLRSVQCPQCAGPLGTREGRRVLACRHCGTRVAVKDRGGVSRWYFPARVDRLEAAAAGADWLRRYPGIARSARDARFVDAELVYVPIWEYRTLLAGWEFGRKVRTRTESVGSGSIMFSGSGNFECEGERLELRLVTEGVKEPCLQERRLYRAAADFGALGATRPKVTGRELLLPLLAGELDASAAVLEVAVDGAEVAARGRRSAMQPLSGAVSPDTHLFTFREKLALLYYPLWVVGYQVGAHQFKVIVNGRNGNVNSAIAPGDNRWRWISLSARVLMSIILVALFAWLAVAHESARTTMAVAAVIVSVAAALYVSRFRTVREVEYHEPFSG